MFEKAEKIAYIYVAPVFYFFGLFGSLANLIILQDQKFNGKIYVYLRGLSLSDLCFLSLISSGEVISHILHEPIPLTIF